MDWQTLRNQFMRNTGGDPPGAHLEDQLITAYSERPDTVERAMTKIALAHKAGKIRSPWGALKAELDKAAENPTHDKGSSRALALQRAEQWVRTAGIHYDRETEIIDELYGDRGPLRAHPDTQTRILELWNELRPLGVILEQELDERMARYRDQAKPEKPTTGNLASAELRALAAQKSNTTPAHILNPPLTQ